MRRHGDEEPDYWALGQASRFVRPGAVRIGSSSLVYGDQLGVSDVAFRNTDGSAIMVAYNSRNVGCSFDVTVGDRHFSARLAPGAAATYRWRAPEQLARAADWASSISTSDRARQSTPTGRLVQSVGAELLGQLYQVGLGDRWLAYSQPYGASLTDPVR